MDILTETELKILDDYGIVVDFNCDDRHVNKFFKKKSVDASKQLLSKSYIFVKQEACSGEPLKQDVVGAYCLSCDSISVLILPEKEKSAFQNQFPRGKGYSSYPAIKIGQLGVSGIYQHKGLYLGSQIIDFIKSEALFKYSLMFGCRFIVLDSYNKYENIHFYQRNGFHFLFDDENQEKLAYHKDMSQQLSTRIMFFDLMDIVLCMRTIENLNNKVLSSNVTLEKSIKGEIISVDTLNQENKGKMLASLNPIQCVYVGNCNGTDTKIIILSNKKESLKLTVTNSSNYDI